MVSVVVCTYTLYMYEHFREAVDSALDQTHDDDQQLSFVDHTTSILADVCPVEHVFAFDGDFRTRNSRCILLT
jgi:predicted nucleic acid-binding protein